MHDTLVSFSILFLVITLAIFTLKKLRQPYQVAYIIAGIILGPSVTAVYTNADTIIQTALLIRIMNCRYLSVH